MNVLSPEELNKIKSMLQQSVTEISDKYIDLTIFCFKNKISFIQNIAIKVQFLKVWFLRLREYTQDIKFFGTFYEFLILKKGFLFESFI